MSELARRWDPSPWLSHRVSLRERVLTDDSNQDKPTQPKRLRIDVEPLSVDERKTSLLKSLYFDQIDTRQMSIKKPYDGTCRWLLKDPHYLEWMSNANNKVLWIRGKPGSGKSTLMEFAHTSARKQAKDDIILSYFFNAYGCYLEKSTLGLYRTLLVQFLKQMPDIQSVLGLLEPSISEKTEDCQWNIESLKQLLSGFIQASKSHSMVLFVDALDECEEQDIRDMISYFEELIECNFSNQKRIRICLASRHYPHISIKSGLYLVLEAKEGHTEDIEAFLSSKLQVGDSHLANHIQRQIVAKASGCFLWAILAARIINKNYDEDRLGSLPQLTEVPDDLFSVFEQILQRNSPSGDLTLNCMQWILFAKTPLTPVQMFFAIHSGIDNTPVSQLDSERITSEKAQRFVFKVSKGLADTTRVTKPTLQFIHESVRDFLLHNYSKIWPDIENNIEGQCQYQLAQCCRTYLNIDLNRHARYPSTIRRTSPEEALFLRNSLNDAYPFLSYAINNMLYHAEKALENGFTNDFLQSIEPSDLQHWIELVNVLERHQVRRYNPDQSLVYILVHRRYPSLLHQKLESNMDLDGRSERRYEDLQVAVEQGYEDIVEILLEHNDRIRFRGETQGLYHSFSNAVLKGQTGIIELLVNSQIADHPNFVKIASESIHTATQLGFERIVEILSAKFSRPNNILELSFTHDEGITSTPSFSIDDSIVSVTHTPQHSVLSKLCNEEAVSFNVPATPLALVPQRDQGIADAITSPRQNTKWNQCPDCDRRFSRATDLHRHKTSIHGPKRYSCPDITCDRKGENAFRRKDHLNEHIYRKHGYRTAVTERTPSFPTSSPSTQLTPNDSASKAEKRRARFDNPYASWKYSLFRSHGLKTCEACRREHTACRLSHMDLKDLSHIPQASWKQCPEPDRLRSEVPSEIHNLPPTS